MNIKKSLNRHIRNLINNATLLLVVFFVMISCDSKINYIADSSYELRSPATERILPRGRNKSTTITLASKPYSPYNVWYHYKQSLPA